MIGSDVIAIGSPHGLEFSLSKGVVSQTRQQGDFIQVDAAINPGNSGGPLLDSSGRVIGMNMAIFSTSGAFSGIGFAVPIDTIKTVVDLLLSSTDGAVLQPKTGLQLAGGTTARALQAQRGLVVLGVEPSSAAAQAGLRAMPPLSFNIFTALQNRRRVDSSDKSSVTDTSPRSPSIPLGDVIIAVNDKQVDTEADFLAALASSRVDDTVRLTIERSLRQGQGRKEVKINLKLSK